MKRSEIKVGEVYGVRCGRFDSYLGSEPVPARVIDVDAAVEWAVPGYSHTRGVLSGGVLVEFVEPTRVGRHSHSHGFSLAKNTNEQAGEVEPRFVFHDKRPGCGGSVGRCFVGLWSELEQERKDQARAERESLAEEGRRADAFAPVLAAYRARLRKVGLRTEVYGDASGLHGDADLSLYSTAHDGKARQRPTGFAYGDVRIAKPLFDQLIDIAERHGEKIRKGL